MLDEIDLHQLNATSRSCEGVLDVRRFDWPADLPDWAKPTDLGLPELVCYGLPPEVVFLGPGQRPMGLQHEINTVVSQALPKLHEAAEVAYTVIVGLLLMLLGLIVVLAVVCYHMDRRARESARLRQLPGRRAPAPAPPRRQRRAAPRSRRTPLLSPPLRTPPHPRAAVRASQSHRLLLRGAVPGRRVRPVPRMGLCARLVLPRRPRVHQHFRPPHLDPEPHVWLQDGLWRWR